jgi:hypothetical protein
MIKRRNLAANWFVVVVPVMGRRSDRNGGRFGRVGGASYMGAGQARQENPPQGTSVCLPYHATPH